MLTTKLHLAYPKRCSIFMVNIIMSFLSQLNYPTFTRTSSAVRYDLNILTPNNTLRVSIPNPYYIYGILIRALGIFFSLGITTLLFGCQGGPLPGDTKINSQTPKNTMHLEIIKPKSISAGKGHFIARDGEDVIAWGNNFSTQSEPPKTAGKFLDFSAGVNDSIYLTDDGRVLSAYYELLTRDPAAYLNLARVISSQNEYYAIRQDGSLVNIGARGWENFKIPQEAKNLVDFKSGTGHFLALLADGTVFCWRDGAEISQFKIPANMTQDYGIVRIATGAEHNLALRADGKVFAWGDNKSGQLNIPPINKKVMDVAAMDESSIALLEDGSLVAWGKPLTAKQLPQDVIEIDAKYNQLIVKKRNGKIQVLQAEIPINYAYLSNAKSISSDLILDTAGNVHPLLATTPEIPDTARTGIAQIQGRDIQFGKYYNFGSGNSFFGIGHMPERERPPAGYEHYDSFYYTTKDINLTISKSGNLTLWGAADAEQLPLPLDLGPVTSAQCAITHCAAIKTNGQVVAWGGNYTGQANVPSSLTKALGIATGDSFTLAINSDHKIVAWGGNEYSELNIPLISRPIIQIIARRFAALALDDLGQVYSLGRDASADPINGDAGPIESLRQFRALNSNGQVYLLPPFALTTSLLDYELPITAISGSGDIVSAVDILGRVDIRGGIRLPADLTEILDTTP